MYRPAWWVPGRHLQTIWGKLIPRTGGGATHIERWDTPDDDFLDIYRLDPPVAAPRTRPRLVLLHGLEGSPRSHYVRSFLAEATRRGWAADVIVFRSCSCSPYVPPHPRARPLPPRARGTTPGPSLLRPALAGSA